MSATSIRKRIVEAIYESRSKLSTRSIGLDELFESLDISPDSVREELTYLEGKELVRREDRQLGNRVYSTLSLTSKGVDFAEGRTETSGQSHQINVSGGSTVGVIGVGGSMSDFRVTQESRTKTVEGTDLGSVAELFRNLRREVEAESPSEVRKSAVERVEELEEAVKAKPPDLATMDYVGNWFRKTLPKLAGKVIGVLVNPIVGKLVEAGGDLAAGELRKRFDGDER